MVEWCSEETGRNPAAPTESREDPMPDEGSTLRARTISLLRRMTTAADHERTCVSCFWSWPVGSPPQHDDDCELDILVGELEAEARVRMPQREAT